MGPREASWAGIAPWLLTGMRLQGGGFLMKIAVDLGS